MKTSFTIDPSAPQDFLFVGSPGTGKTSLALNFPSPYVADLDENLRPAVQHTGKTTFGYDSGNTADDGTFLEPPKRWGELVKRLNAAVADPNIRTIIIDSLTALTDILIAECKRAGGLNDSAPMRVQDWGTFSQLLRNLIIKLKASGKHLVVIAHHKLEKDEADGKFKYLLNLPGNNQFIVSGLFSNVWCMFFDDPTGVPGPNQKNVLKVRTIPLSKNDFRGAKTGIKELLTEQPMDEVIKKLPNIVK